MAGGRQGEKNKGNQLLLTPAQAVDLPGPCSACTKAVQARVHPCMRGQIMWSVLPFPGADWLLQTHLMGPWPFSQS